jgi:hypothetical protein
VTKDHTDNSREHRINLFLVIACLIALAAIYLLTVAKDHHTLNRLQKQISEVSKQADRQEMLQPIMEEFQKKEETTLAETGRENPILLSESAAEDYQETLSKLVQKCDLELTGLVPDIDSILSDDGRITVNLTTRGEFSDFKRLILQIGRLPYIEALDQFRVGPANETTGLEMLLKLPILLSPETGDPTTDDIDEDQ